MVQVRRCRAVSSYCTPKSVMYASRTLETFGWPAKEYLGALSLRNDAIEAYFQVDCRAVLPSPADVCKASSDVFVQVESSTVRH